MTTTTLNERPAGDAVKETKKTANGKITVFHCFNAAGKITAPGEDYEITSINLPCSGMTRDMIILKAFEAGADAVIVLACPEKTCHYLEGNLRAKKRVARVKKLLDEAGLDGEMLSFYNVSPGDDLEIQRIIRKSAAQLAERAPCGVH